VGADRPQVLPDCAPAAAARSAESEAKAGGILRRPKPRELRRQVNTGAADSRRTPWLLSADTSSLSNLLLLRRDRIPERKSFRFSLRYQLFIWPEQLVAGQWSG